MSETRKCRGKTSKGARCKLPARKGGYCDVFHKAPERRIRIGKLTVKIT